METVNRIVVKRVDGVYVNLKFEPVKTMRAAARFDTLADYEYFMYQGHYKPSNPNLYIPQEIKVTYEEV